MKIPLEIQLAIKGRTSISTSEMEVEPSRRSKNHLPAMYSRDRMKRVMVKIGKTVKTVPVFYKKNPGEVFTRVTFSPVTTVNALAL